MTQRTEHFRADKSQEHGEKDVLDVFRPLSLRSPLKIGQAFKGLCVVHNPSQGMSCHPGQVNMHDQSLTSPAGPWNCLFNCAQSQGQGMSAFFISVCPHEVHCVKI